MKLFGVSVAAALLAAAPAWAQTDKPVVGPPPAWVLPPPTATPEDSAEGSALQMRLVDIQEHFDGQASEVYGAFQEKVRSAAGLQGAGTIPLRWAPATETLTVHHLRILRGAQVIDCLPKDGAFTILRREQKLEDDGLLDGVLTALVQPEGLRVGDVLDVAYTIRHADPILKGAVDMVSMGFDGSPVDHVRLRALWPSSMPVRWKTAKTLAAPRLQTRGGETEALIELDHMRPLVSPQGAPVRFQLGRQLSLSSYPDWASAAAVIAPLFAEAAQLKPNSPIAAEAKRIAAQSPEPLVRAGLALSLVEQQVRYLAYAIGENGMKPATADLTWTRRWGDCKAKTVLLMSLLKALGIAAEPVLVSTTLGDAMDERLPTVRLFDHVVVRARIDGRDWWLDGTRLGDSDLNLLSTPDYGWVLPLRERGAVLQHVTAEPLKLPETETRVTIDAHGGRTPTVKAHAERILRGDASRGMQLVIERLPKEEFDRALKTYLQEQVDDFTVSQVSVAPLNAKGETRLIADGEIKIDWTGYEPDGATLGFKPDLRREAGPDADAPFAVGFPSYTLWDVSIRLPEDGKGFATVGSNVDRTLFGRAYHRRAEIKDGVFHIETSVKALQPEITVAQAKTDADALTEMSKKTVKLYATTARATPKVQSLAESMKTEPTTRDGYIARGSRLLDDARYAEAERDFDHAVSMDPGSANVFANRGLARAWQGKSAAAKVDFDKAESLDPSEVVIWRGRGLLAGKEARWADAVAAFSRAIELKPGDAFALAHRAAAYEKLADLPRALADLDAMIAANPTDNVGYFEKINLLVRRGDKPAALAVARAAEAAKVDPYLTVQMKAGVLVLQGDHVAALAAVDAFMARQKKAADLYLIRARMHPRDDAVGRAADVDAALALEPKNEDALRFGAAYAEQAGDLKRATALIDRLHAIAPDDLATLLSIGGLQQRMGDPNGARGAFLKVRGRVAADAESLNSLCWREATTGFDAGQALADCEASLKLAPAEGATLDSKGFVLLRLKQDAEALDAYEQALKLRPHQAASLYGKSIAETRLMRPDDADRDRKAALALEAGTEKTFAGYGVSR